jgi:hypothetical protein
MSCRALSRAYSENVEAISTTGGVRPCSRRRGRQGWMVTHTSISGLGKPMHQTAIQRRGSSPCSSPQSSFPLWTRRRKGLLRCGARTDGTSGTTRTASGSPYIDIERSRRRWHNAERAGRRPGNVGRRLFRRDTRGRGPDAWLSRRQVAPAREGATPLRQARRPTAGCAVTCCSSPPVRRPLWPLVGRKQPPRRAAGRAAQGEVTLRQAGYALGGRLPASSSLPSRRGSALGWILVSLRVRRGGFVV